MTDGEQPKTALDYSPLKRPARVVPEQPAPRCRVSRGANATSQRERGSWRGPGGRGEPAPTDSPRVPSGERSWQPRPRRTRCQAAGTGAPPHRSDRRAWRPCSRLCRRRRGPASRGPCPCPRRRPKRRRHRRRSETTRRRGPCRDPRRRRTSPGAERASASENASGSVSAKWTARQQQQMLYRRCRRARARRASRAGPTSTHARACRQPRCCPPRAWPWRACGWP